MGGISSSVGLISGIDTGALIQQLLQIEARPRELASQRLVQLQTQQAAFLDLNTRLSSLKSAASTFHVSNIFDSAKASSSDENALTATASTSAQPGTYSFIVDRLVSTQQLLSKGFADQDTSSFGATSFTFEGAEAKLESDVGLADLNGGAGIKRGTFQITDSAGASATIDLSRTATVGEALDAINGAGIGVTAKTLEDRIVLTDTAGGASVLTVSDIAGSTTASELGIDGVAAGGKITGKRVYYATGSTAIAQLNDGTGIARTSTVGTGAFDFTVRVDGVDVKVFLGQTTETTTDPNTGEETTVTTPAASTINEVLTRINDALTETLGATTTLSASLKSDGTGLQIVDSAGTAVIAVLDRGEETGGTAVQTTARDLGIAGSGTGSITGSRIFGGLNSVLSKSLNGGQGITGDG
ncbi:MAG TPA: hypothetical protein ENJ00_07305, partial [Phycisphaerales bacterium]|nr:hypothetical protein [Phycisphaerales bacterium]